MRGATLNMRTLGGFGFDFVHALAHLGPYMEKHDIDVLFLTETHCTGRLDEIINMGRKAYRVIASGLESVHQQGVAFIIRTGANIVVRDIIYDEVEPGRILRLAAEMDDRVYHLIGTYVPAFNLNDRTEREDMAIFSNFLLLLEGHMSTKRCLIF